MGELEIRFEQGLHEEGLKDFALSNKPACRDSQESNRSALLSELMKGLAGRKINVHLHLSRPGQQLAPGVQAQVGVFSLDGD